MARVDFTGSKKIKQRVVDTVTFIKVASRVHNNRYDYHNSRYVKSSEKIEIRCAEHGYFWQVANEHESLDSQR